MRDDPLARALADLSREAAAARHGLVVVMRSGIRTESPATKSWVTTDPTLPLDAVEFRHPDGRVERFISG